MNIFRSKKDRIKMVQDSDLTEYLKSIGIYQSIIDNKKHCKYCGNLVNLNNLQAILPGAKEIVLVCDNPSCISKLQHYDR